MSDTYNLLARAISLRSKQLLARIAEVHPGKTDLVCREAFGVMPVAVYASYVADDKRFRCSVIYESMSQNLDTGKMVEATDTLHVSSPELAKVIKPLTLTERGYEKQFSNEVMRYTLHGGDDEIKRLLALELDRSKVQALQELSRRFSAELAGEEPEPPIASSIGRQALLSLRAQ